jgi:outer membrane protein
MNHRTRRLTAGTVILAALAAIAPPAARAADGPKIGYVDVQQVAARSRSIQGEIKAVEQKLKVQQDEIEIMIRDFGKARDDLRARRSVLTAAEVAKQEEKVEKMRDDIELKRLDIDKQWRKTESDVMGPAVDRIIETVRAVGKRDGYDLILTSDIVIFAAEKINLTALIVEELDKGAPKSDAKSDTKGDAKK